jgi:hypothetical protein
MSILVQSPFPVFTDIDGDPLESGFIFVGIANLNPLSNPQNVYWDINMTIPAVNIRTSGGYAVHAGSPGRLYAQANYSILVKNKNGTIVYSNLNNQGNTFAIQQIENMQALLNYDAAVSGATVELLGFHTQGDGGGGIFIWNPSANKNTHDGGTIIDPSNSADLGVWDIAEQTIWFTPGVGTGCWIRSWNLVDISVEYFGGVPNYNIALSTGFNSSLSFSAAMALITNNSQVSMNPGVYYIANAPTVELTANNFSIVGHQTTLFRPSAISGGSIYFKLIACHDVEIAGINFDAHDSYSANNSIGTLLDGCFDINIHHNIYDECNRGVSVLSHSERIKVEHNSQTGRLNWGDNWTVSSIAYFYEETVDSSFSYNYTKRTKFAVIGEKTRRISVIGNRCFDSFDSTLYLHGDGHIFNDNYIENAGKDAIKSKLTSGDFGNIVYGDPVIISNNIIKNAGVILVDGGIGIFAEHDHTSIQGNSIQFEDPSAFAAAECTGIIARGKNYVITDNQVVSISGLNVNNGISIGSASVPNGSDMIISGNVFTNLSKAIAIADAGTYDLIQISNNKFNDVIYCLSASHSAPRVSLLEFSSNYIKTPRNRFIVLDRGTNIDVKNNLIADIQAMSYLFRMRNSIGLNRIESNRVVDNSITNITEPAIMDVDSNRDAYMFRDNLFGLNSLRDSVLGLMGYKTMLDDTVLSFALGSNIMACTLTIVTRYQTVMGIVFLRLHNNYAAAVVDNTGDFTTASSGSVLIGTTGADNKLNISLVNGTVYIENRLGVTTYLSYKIDNILGLI